jgi:hypothetical protein
LRTSWSSVLKRSRWINWQLIYIYVLSSFILNLWSLIDKIMRFIFWRIVIAWCFSCCLYKFYMFSRRLWLLFRLFNCLFWHVCHNFLFIKICSIVKFVLKSVEWVIGPKTTRKHANFFLIFFYKFCFILFKTI